MNILVTGSAGFIGYHLTKRLLNDGHHVTGIDNLNSYYTVTLKKNRLKDTGISIESEDEGSLEIKSKTFDGYTFIQADLGDRDTIEDIFKRHEFDAVINLAAQAGVRYSLKNPHAYINSNINGFLNILEGCRHQNVGHLIYASSSSVYGDSTDTPFKTSHSVDHPVSLYAATKKSNELMAHTYSHLYDIPSTGLRFFTVYGPWGRPDMAYFKFAELMSAGKPIDIYNNGEMFRDFTYIDDIIESIVRLLPKPPTSDENKSVPQQLFNIGHGDPVNLMDFIHILEEKLGIEAKKNFKPMQPGDVPRTWADTEDLFNYIDFRPEVSFEKGIEEFVNWYRSEWLDS
jgi:UDP-glucuronate 4-epimerase